MRKPTHGPNPNILAGIKDLPAHVVSSRDSLASSHSFPNFDRKAIGVSKMKQSICPLISLTALFRLSTWLCGIREQKIGMAVYLDLQSRYVQTARTTSNKHSSPAPRPSLFAPFSPTIQALHETKNLHLYIEKQQFPGESSLSLSASFEVINSIRFRFEIIRTSVTQSTFLLLMFIQH